MSHEIKRIYWSAKVLMRELKVCSLTRIVDIVSYKVQCKKLNYYIAVLYVNTQVEQKILNLKTEVGIDLCNKK